MLDICFEPSVDVYKRQDMGLTSDLGELGVPYEKDFDEMAEKAASEDLEHCRVPLTKSDVVAVSYTHLDVYKRQAYLFETENMKLPDNIPHKENAAYIAALYLQKKPLANVSEPVSYTHLSEDAGYLRQDGKTPWSFTPVWYWDSVLHVQDRWEARRW